VIDVSQHPADESDRTALPPADAAAGTETIESYETDDGVVFYDAENPLAWVETSQTMRLADLA